MSPACIAQLLGLASALSRSASARDATGSASRQTVAIASAGRSHGALTRFITPPLVIDVPAGDTRATRDKRRIAQCLRRSVCLRFDKVNLLGTGFSPSHGAMRRAASQQESLHTTGGIVDVRAA